MNKKGFKSSGVQQIIDLLSLGSGSELARERIKDAYVQYADG